MAAGAAATIRANVSASRIARTGKPRTVRATTQNSEKRLRGDLLGGFDQTEVRHFGDTSGFLRRRG